MLQPSPTLHRQQLLHDSGFQLRHPGFFLLQQGRINPCCPTMLQLRLMVPIDHQLLQELLPWQQLQRKLLQKILPTIWRRTTDTRHLHYRGPMWREALDDQFRSIQHKHLRRPRPVQRLPTSQQPAERLHDQQPSRRHRHALPDLQQSSLRLRAEPIQAVHRPQHLEMRLLPTHHLEQEQLRHRAGLPGRLRFPV